jgi:formate/nitrite transporter FocA (FNT family)
MVVSVVLAGEAKPRNSLLKEMVLGFLAGTFIGFGFSTCMIAAGQVRSSRAGFNMPCTCMHACWGDSNKI